MTPPALPPPAPRRGGWPALGTDLAVTALAILLAVTVELSVSREARSTATWTLFGLGLALWVGRNTLGYLPRATPATPAPAGAARSRFVLSAALLVVGAAGAGAGGPGSLVLLAVGLLGVVAALDAPLVPSVLALAAGVVAFGLARRWLVPDDVAVSVGSTLTVVVLAGGFGLLRRQTAGDRRAARRLVEQRARNAVLAERARIARDIHDVLAHSLGGLVLQLDALDALVSDGGVDEAVVVRVRRARAMAAEGLDDAKDAVDALRSFSGPFDVALASAVSRARATGQQVETHLDGEPSRVPEVVTDVLVSVAVEALSNARSHAPGTPVTVGTVVRPGTVRLRVVNPVLPTPAGAERQGHGLTGMRERLALVGGTVVAGSQGQEWVVECEVMFGAA